MYADIYGNLYIEVSWSECPELRQPKKIEKINMVEDRLNDIIRWLKEGESWVVVGYS